MKTVLNVGYATGMNIPLLTCAHKNNSVDTFYVLFPPFVSMPYLHFWGRELGTETSGTRTTWADDPKGWSLCFVCGRHSWYWIVSPAPSSVT